MRFQSIIFIFIMIFTLSILNTYNVYSGVNSEEFELVETDNDQNRYIAAFFDLRERETYVQTTNTINSSTLFHIQIFDVSNNCNENNFFDNFTGNDTHTYNMRDIQTNDGNPSGVVLPDNSYGLVIVAPFIEGERFVNGNMIGNFRILDNNGYEYRTNMPSRPNGITGDNPNNVLTFNFNNNTGVILSDVVGMILNVPSPPQNNEVVTANITEAYISYDIDIYNNNEVPFSCRDVTFACTDENNPLYEELLAITQTSVANFEYGINDAIPHSKGGELLCPGNNISEGIVRMDLEAVGFDRLFKFIFVGLNNGNERGSLETIWDTSDFGTPDPPPPG